ncbi:helix-turn-helix domain-containing protein [Streptomyces sp. SID5998]|nr:helix-turn-helix domain-containing protein [Streptomyces sp. SID5998]
MSNRSRSSTGAQTTAPARATPSADAARAQRCTEAIRDIAEDFAVLSETLMNSAYGVAAPTTEMLQLVVALDHLAQEATAVLVVRQRSQGEPLRELEQILGRSGDRLRKKYSPRAVDEAIRTRRRPQRATLPQPTPAGPLTPNLLRTPRQRLACALTIMQRGSGRRQRDIAHRIGIDESYVSRMLSGQRELSWKYVVAICEVCGGDTELVKPLWEVAAGVPFPDDTPPVQYLRTYLQALRYAAGSPAPEKILESAQHRITADDLDLALHGPGVPSWSTVAELAAALQSLPDAAKPLWRRAQTAAETGTSPS